MLAGVFLLLTSALAAQTSEYPYSWLQGRWTGDGFGGTSEEVWSSPGPDGKMMGVYRHYKGDGSLNFYEFLILDSAGVHLKHFTPALIGWEEKEDFLTFSKVQYTDKLIELKGLIFEYFPPDKMKIHLKMTTSDGNPRTEVFLMRRGE